MKRRRICTNYFIEGLQGSGKSTLVRKLSEKYPDYKAICEGDYSPVELAWCAYVDKETYNGILKRYSDIRSEIEEKSIKEGAHMIICYTKIITDIHIGICNKQSDIILQHNGA